MLRKIALTIGASLLMQATLAQTNGAQSPLQAYRSEIEFGQAFCGMAVETAILTGNLSTQRNVDEIEKCIAGSKTKTRALLDATLKTLTTPTATDALKAYHVSYVTALEGLRPASGERKISYQGRQAALQGKMTEAWARFELEQ